VIVLYIITIYDRTHMPHAHQVYLEDNKQMLAQPNSNMKLHKNNNNNKTSWWL